MAKSYAMMHSRNRGFTMIEVMIAVALLGMLSLLMYESMALTFKSRERIARVEDLVHSAQVSLRRLASDISMAYLSNHVYVQEPTSSTLFIGKSDNILFSYLGHVRRQRDARESDQGTVEYLLERDPDGNGKAIVRREKTIMDTEPERGGNREVLVSGVKEFRLLYWDEKNEDWEDEWRAEMDEATMSGLNATPTGQTVSATASVALKQQIETELEKFKLPSRVYVRLVLMDSEGTEFPFETQTQIHLQSPLNF